MQLSYQLTFLIQGMKKTQQIDDALKKLLAATPPEFDDKQLLEVWKSSISLYQKLEKVAL